MYLFISFYCSASQPLITYVFVLNYEFMLNIFAFVRFCTPFILSSFLLPTISDPILFREKKWENKNGSEVFFVRLHHWTLLKMWRFESTDAHSQKSWSETLNRLEELNRYDRSMFCALKLTEAPLMEPSQIKKKMGICSGDRLMVNTLVDTSSIG